MTFKINDQIKIVEIVTCPITQQTKKKKSRQFAFL